METKIQRKGVTPPSNEEIVNRYFQLITLKDVPGLVDLFAYDGVIYEPFSNETNGLRGKLAIESFFKVAVMANAGMSRTIKIVDNTKDSITALVLFEKGEKIQGRFTFYFETDDSKNIRMLKIQFREP